MKDSTKVPKAWGKKPSGVEFLDEINRTFEAFAERQPILCDALPEFADWLFANVLPKVNSYKSDLFHDIARIMAKRNAAMKAGITSEQITDEYYLFVRDTGTWMCQITGEDRVKDIYAYARQNKWAYHIRFCWNSDYFATPLAEVTDLDIETLK